MFEASTLVSDSKAFWIHC